MSSNVVRFTTEHPLSQGESVEVTVNWPALVNDKCLIKLVIHGRVIRSDSGSAAVQIANYEFRTRGKAAPPFGGVGGAWERMLPG